MFILVFMNSLLMLLIVFLLLVVVLAVIIRFVKNLVRIIIVVGLLALVFGAGIYVLNDANNLQKKFLPGEKLLVLDLDSNITAAVISKDIAVPVPVTKVDALDLLYSEKDYSEMLDDKYKLVVFKWGAFDDIDFVGTDEYRFSMKEVRQIMEASSPREFLVDKMAEEQGEELRQAIRSEVFSRFPTKDHLRSVAFSFMIAKFIDQGSVFEEYIDGNVLIYPETITLKIVKIIPFSWIRGFLPENNLR